MAAEVPIGESRRWTPLRYNPSMSKLSISQEQVRRLARLACLHLDESEERRMVGDIHIVLDYMSLLRNTAIDDVSVLETGISELRDDEPHTGEGTVEVLRSCVDAAAGGFVVPAFDARVRGPDRDDGS